MPRMDSVGRADKPELSGGPGLVGTCVVGRRRVPASGPESTRSRCTGYTMPSH